MGRHCESFVFNPHSLFTVFDTCVFFQLLLNEEVSVLDLFTTQRNTSRPIILFTSSRGAAEHNRAVNAYVAAGGFARQFIHWIAFIVFGILIYRVWDYLDIIYKPAGPTKINQAMRACVDYLVNTRFRMQTSSFAARRSFGRSLNSPRTPSEPDLSLGSIHSPIRVGSALSGVDESETTYFSGAFGAHSSVVTSAAAHQLSPAHFLQRRRSEEERDHRRKVRRPVMAPRSITFQPDTLAAGSPSATAPPLLVSQRRVSQQSEDELSTPSSPGSVISIGGGGVVLKAATALEEDMFINSGRAKKVPVVLVVEVSLV